MRAVRLAVTACRRVGVRQQSSASDTVGFIGVGAMGWHMAHNLVKAGKTVVVFDVMEAAVSALVAEGARRASSPGEVTSAAQTVISSLPNGAIVNHVYRGENGVLSGAVEDTLLIDTSTIEPAVAQAIRRTAASKGATFIDAPVSGGTMGAEQGTLTFMVGGAEADFARAQGVLEIMGSRAVHCGESGMGQTAKLCNNLALAVTMAGIAEAHVLGDRLGIDQKKLANVLNTSTGRSWSSDTYNPCPGVMEGVPASRDYTGGFACDLMVKDLRLASAAATASQQKAGLPMLGLVQQLYTLMSAQGHGGKDFSRIFKMLNGN